MKKLLYTLALTPLFILTPDLGVSTSYGAIDLYFTRTKTINFARDKFYESVQVHLDKENFEINDSYSLSRQALTMAHPPAKRDLKNTKVLIPKSLKKMIPKIQRNLEVKAKENALIIDCGTIKSKYVTNCGIYRYSRKKQRIDASSVRYFSIEIDNPEMWAQHIVTNYKMESSKEKERAESRLMNDFISELKHKEPIKQNKNSFLLLGANSKQIAGNELSGLSLEYAKGDLSSSTLFGVSFSDSLNDTGLEKVQEIVIGVKNIAPAIHKLYWEMAYKLHLGNHQFSEGLQDEKHMGISLSPGVSIALDNKGQFKVHGAYSIRRNIKLDNYHDTIANSFWESNWQLSLVKTI